PAEALQPGLVAEQDVAEGAVDRLEEGAQVAPALLVAEVGGGAVELLVHPAVVGRHPAGVSGQSHVSSGWCADGGSSSWCGPPAPAPRASGPAAGRGCPVVWPG